MSMITKATKFAKEAHKGQMRKMSKTPYVGHVLNVGKILKKYGYSEDVISAGILHDTIEDTPVTFEDIEKEFNINIAELVDSASETDKADTWENRKKHTIKALKGASKESMAIIAADKLDNLSSIVKDMKSMGDKVWKVFKAPKDRQSWYYGSILEILESKLGKGGMIKELRKAYDILFSDIKAESFKDHYYK